MGKKKRSNSIKLLRKAMAFLLCFFITINTVFGTLVSYAQELPDVNLTECGKETESVDMTDGESSAADVASEEPGAAEMTVEETGSEVTASEEPGAAEMTVEEPGSEESVDITGDGEIFMDLDRAESEMNNLEAEGDEDLSLTSGGVLSSHTFYSSYSPNKSWRDNWNTKSMADYERSNGLSVANTFKQICVNQLSNKSVACNGYVCNVLKANGEMSSDSYYTTATFAGWLTSNGYYDVLGGYKQLVQGSSGNRSYTTDADSILANVQSGDILLWAYEDSNGNFTPKHISIGYVYDGETLGGELNSKDTFHTGEVCVFQSNGASITTGVSTVDIESVSYYLSGANSTTSYGTAVRIFRKNQVKGEFSISKTTDTGAYKDNVVFGLYKVSNGGFSLLESGGTALKSDITSLNLSGLNDTNISSAYTYAGVSRSGLLTKVATFTTDANGYGVPTLTSGIVNEHNLASAGGDWYSIAVSGNKITGLPIGDYIVIEESETVSKADWKKGGSYGGITLDSTTVNCEFTTTSTSNTIKNGMQSGTVNKLCDFGFGQGKQYYGAFSISNGTSARAIVGTCRNYIEEKTPHVDIEGNLYTMKGAKTSGSSITIKSSLSGAVMNLYRVPAASAASVDYVKKNYNTLINNGKAELIGQTVSDSNGCGKIVSSKYNSAMDLGTTDFHNLPSGYYYFTKEITAPVGYKLSSDIAIVDWTSSTVGNCLDIGDYLDIKMTLHKYSATGNTSVNLSGGTFNVYYFSDVPIYYSHTQTVDSGRRTIVTSANMKNDTTAILDENGAKITLATGQEINRKVLFSYLEANSNCLVQPSYPNPYDANYESTMSVYKTRYMQSEYSEYYQLSQMGETERNMRIRSMLGSNASDTQISQYYTRLKTEAETDWSNQLAICENAGVGSSKLSDIISVSTSEKYIGWKKGWTNYLAYKKALARIEGTQASDIDYDNLESKLAKWGGVLVATWTTDSAGVGHLSYVNGGTNSYGRAYGANKDTVLADLMEGYYLIKETKAPANYEINKKLIEVTADTGTTYDVKIEDKTTPRNIVLQKSSTNPAIKYDLSGAVYAVYSNSASAKAATKNNYNQLSGYVGALLTNSNGDAGINNLDPMKYYVKEVIAPENFEIDTNVYTVPLDDASQLVDNTSSLTYTLKVADNAKTRSLSLVKASANPTLTNGKSSYSIKGAVYAVYTDKTAAQSSTKNNYTSLTGYVGSFTTDESGNTDTIKNLAIQTYYVKEIAAPAHYKLDTTVYTCDLSDTEKLENGTYLLKVTDTPEVSLKLKKSSANTSVTNGNNCYSLKGAVYAVYKNKETAAAADKGNYKKLGGYVGSLTTDENGNSNKLEGLNCQTYYVKEVIAPEGYALDTTVYACGLENTAKLENDTYTLTVADTPQVNPVGVLLSKKSSKNGQAISGAEITVKFYAGEYGDGVDPGTTGVKPTKTWVIGTDDEGYAKLDASHRISGDAFYVYSDTGETYLPLGTVTLQETKAPARYKLNPEIFVRKINSDGSGKTVNTYNEAVLFEQPSDGYLRIIKKDDKTNKNILNTNGKIKFKIWSYTDNKYVSFTVDGNNVSEFPLGNDGVITTYEPIEIGKYRIEEINNTDTYYLKYTNGSVDVTMGTDTETSVYVDEDGNETTIPLYTYTLDNTPVYGTVTINKVGQYYVTENGKSVKKEINLSNVSFDIIADEDVYSKDGQTLLLKKGTVADTITTDKNGNATSKEIPLGAYIIREKSIPSGYFTLENDVKLELTASDGITTTTTGNIQKKAVNVTKKLTNYKEMTITTTATDKNTGIRNSNAAKNAVIYDDVLCTNLVEGKTYTIKGKLMDKSTGKALVVDGKEVTASKSFVAEDGIMTVRMEYSFDASGLAGKETVVYEELYEGNILRAAHEDINDENQTILFASAHTTALGNDTKDHISYADKETSITDTVKYTNLIVGKTYTVSGTLMNKNTGLPITVDGKEITAEKTFTAETRDGSVELVFTFDASALKGETVVAFETVSYNDVPVAVHADLEDKEQTVRFPKLETTAADKKTGDHITYAEDNASIIDRVEYENLIAGKEYTVTGILMNKDTNLPLMVNEMPVTKSLTFTAENSDGFIDMEFTLDASVLAGQAIVVFEDIAYNEITVAVHNNLEDKGQTVYIPKISTSAKEKTKGTKTTMSAENYELIDTVTYDSLIPGREYVIRGTLMDATDAAEIICNGSAVTGYKRFTAESESGSEDVEFTFSGREFADVTTVVFEELYLISQDEDGSEIEIPVALHKDIQDEGQSVYIDYTKVGFEKVDASTGEALVGACLELYDSEENPVESWITDGSEHIINNLAPGSYTLVEKTAPKGYAVAESISFEIDDTSEKQSITMQDEVITGSVHISKVDYVNENKKLQGVSFMLFKTSDSIMDTQIDRDYLASWDALKNESEDGNAELIEEINSKKICEDDMYIGAYVTDENGEISVEELSYGSYYLVETQTLESYDLLMQTVDFDVDETHIKNELIIANIGREGWVVYGTSKKTISENTKSLKTEERETTVKTGDEMDILLVLVVMVTAFGMFVVLIRRRKRVQELLVISALTCLICGACINGNHAVTAMAKETESQTETVEIEASVDTGYCDTEPAHDDYITEAYTDKNTGEVYEVRLDYVKSECIESGYSIPTELTGTICDYGAEYFMYRGKRYENPGDNLSAMQGMITDFASDCGYAEGSYGNLTYEYQGAAYTDEFGVAYRDFKVSFDAYGNRYRFYYAGSVEIEVETADDTNQSVEDTATAEQSSVTEKQSGNATGESSVTEKQSGNATGESSVTEKQSGNATGESSVIAKQSENSAGQQTATAAQSSAAAKQSDNTAAQPSRTTEQSENSADVSETASENDLSESAGQQVKDAENVDESSTAEIANMILLVLMIGAVMIFAITRTRRGATEG